MPDLDALEKAMAVAHGEGDEAAAEDADDMPVLKPEPVLQEEPPEEIPEITLDNAIQQRIHDNLIDEHKGSYRSMNQVFDRVMADRAPGGKGDGTENRIRRRSCTATIG